MKKYYIVSTNAYELCVEDTYTLTYTVYPTSLQDTALEWKSSNEEIATVDNSGNITAVSCGQVNITASSRNGVIAICSITVKEKPAYERLTEKEKQFVDMFLKHIDQFKNPTSVNVKEIEGDHGVYTVKVSAQNGFGGNNVSVYNLSESLGLWNWESFDFDIDIDITPDLTYDIELINAAIKERYL